MSMMMITITMLISHFYFYFGLGIQCSIIFHVEEFEVNDFGIATFTLYL